MRAEDSAETTQMPMPEPESPQSAGSEPAGSAAPAARPRWRRPRRAAGRGRKRFALRRGAAWWLYIGVVMFMAGFGLITYAWLKVAVLANVALQIPYVVSSAIAGVAIVLGGLGIVAVTTRRRDAQERTKQLGQLRDLLRGIADSLDPEKKGTPQAGDATAGDRAKEEAS